MRNYRALLVAIALILASCDGDSICQKDLEMERKLKEECNEHVRQLLQRTDEVIADLTKSHARVHELEKQLDEIDSIVTEGNSDREIVERLQTVLSETRK